MSLRKISSSLVFPYTQPSSLHTLHPYTHSQNSTHTPAFGVAFLQRNKVIVDTAVVNRTQQSLIWIEMVYRSSAMIDSQPIMFINHLPQC